jgi:2-hydroxychromene-2-carboxylate isomerase
MQATWYFDVISPYSYLHFRLFDQIAWPGGVAPAIELVPVLFAGLLKANATKGPAEIAEKRRHTYRSCVWIAQQNNIPFRLPPAHPFNPLHALRLLTGAGATPAHVGAVFDCIWKDGQDVNSAEVFGALAGRLGVTDPQELISRPAVKQQLVANTERALRRGIYGVPTFDLGGELFWGSDTLAMMNAWLADPGLFNQGEMARVNALPAAAMRKEAA